MRFDVVLVAANTTSRFGHWTFSPCMDGPTSKGKEYAVRYEKGGGEVKLTWEQTTFISESEYREFDLRPSQFRFGYSGLPSCK